MRYLFLQPRLFMGFDRKLFWARTQHHFSRWGVAYLVFIIAAACFHARFDVTLNISPSLPQRFFIIHKGELPQRGQYLAFRWPGGGPYPAGMTFIKVAAGMAGDVVTAVDGEFFLNGVPAGHAKPISRRGLRLDPGPTGTIPPGQYYVWAPHPDSLDSRYRLTGWISEAQIIGVAHALF